MTVSTLPLNDWVTVWTSTTAVAEIKAGTTDVKILLTNDSANIIYVAIGGNAVMNKGIRLDASGWSLAIDLSESFLKRYSGVTINAISSASSNLCVCIIN